VVTGCVTGAPPARTERAGLIGAPPTATEDPFAERTLPSEAARAPTSGMIGDEDARNGAAAPSNRATPATPDDGPKPADEVVGAPAPPEVERCFSCVRICPEGVSVAECEEREDELICGWGSDRDRQQARRLARAQCDGALDMSRRMGRFSEIEGSCPPAACR
jgi:hypothetical protein